MGMYERRVSRAKEIDGVPIEYDGFRVTIARSGGHNKAYLKYMEELAKPQRKSLEAGFITNEKATEWRKKAMAATLIKLWEVQRPNPMFDNTQPESDENSCMRWVEGMDDPNSKNGVIPFNEENVLKVIMNEDFHDYFEDFWRMSEEMRIYREILNENDLKN